MKATVLTESSWFLFVFSTLYTEQQSADMSQIGFPSLFPFSPNFLSNSFLIGTLVSTSYAHDNVLCCRKTYTHTVSCDEPLENKWCRVLYSADPHCLLFADRNSVYMLDKRVSDIVLFSF